MSDLRTVSFKITADSKQALDAFIKTQQELGKVIGYKEKATQATDQHTRSTANFNMVGMNFNRIISDSPYFLSSMQMGIMSIGNNIGPMVESLNAAKNATGSWKSVVMSAFTGAGGVMTLISLATAGITAWALANRSASNEVKEHKQKVDEFARSLESMSKISLGATLVQKQMDYERAEFLRKQYAGRQGRNLESDEYKELSAAAKLAEAEVRKVQQAMSGSGYLQDLKNRLAELEKIKMSLSKEQLKGEAGKNIEAQIKSIRQELEGGSAGKSGLLNVLENKQNLLSDAIGAAKTLDEVRNLTIELDKVKQEIFQIQFYANSGFKSIEEFSKAITVQPRGLQAQNSIFNTPKELKGREMPGGYTEGLILTEEQKAKIQADLKQQYSALSVIANSAAQSIENQFKKMWKNIFGEANNLLEEFLQNVASGLMSLAAQELSSSIFSGFMSLLNPLSAIPDLTGGISRLFSPGASSGGTVVIPVNIGQDKVTTVVANGYIEARSLRLIEG